jgi:hypothetical protein
VRAYAAQERWLTRACGAGPVVWSGLVWSVFYTQPTNALTRGAKEYSVAREGMRVFNCFALGCKPRGD